MQNTELKQNLKQIKNILVRSRFYTQFKLVLVIRFGSNKRTDTGKWQVVAKTEKTFCCLYIIGLYKQFEKSIFAMKLEFYLQQKVNEK